MRTSRWAPCLARSPACLLHHRRTQIPTGSRRAQRCHRTPLDEVLDVGVSVRGECRTRRGAVVVALDGRHLLMYTRLILVRRTTSSRVLHSRITSALSTRCFCSNRAYSPALLRHSAPLLVIELPLDELPTLETGMPFGLRARVGRAAARLCALPKSARQPVESRMCALAILYSLPTVAFTSLSVSVERLGMCSPRTLRRRATTVHKVACASSRTLNGSCTTSLAVM